MRRCYHLSCLIGGIVVLGHSRSVGEIEVVSGVWRVIVRGCRGHVCVGTIGVVTTITDMLTTTKTWSVLNSTQIYCESSSTRPNKAVQCSLKNATTNKTYPILYTMWYPYNKRHVPLTQPERVNTSWTITTAQHPYQTSPSPSQHPQHPSSLSSACRRLDNLDLRR